MIGSQWSSLLELGSWNIDKVEKNIREINEQTPDYCARCEKWCLLFMGTPCFYESNLPELNINTIRVRLETFDCITFIYTIIALAGSYDFNDFVCRLKNIRYKDSRQNDYISNDILTGNFIDFACEALLYNGCDCGFIEDITSKVFLKQNELLFVDMPLLPCERPRNHDVNSKTVFPKYTQRRVETHIIPSNKIDEISLSELRSGDIAIFTHGMFNKKGKRQASFICHCGFVSIRDGKLCLIHATRNFSVAAENRDRVEMLKQKNDLKKEFLGVWYAGEYLGDEFTVQGPNETFHGYYKDRIRLLSDYAESIFLGVKFLRVRG